MSVRQKAFLGLILAAVLWGSAGTTAKLLISEANPFVITFYRFLGSTLIVLPFFLAAKKPKHWLRTLLPLGIFNTGNVLFYYSALAYTTANTGSLLGAATPLVTAVLSYVLIAEPIAKNKIAGILVGLLGALLIILTPVLEKGQAVGTGMFGNVLMLGSALSWTLYVIHSKKLSGQKDFSPLLATFVNFATCTLSALLISVVTGKSLLIPAFANLGYLTLYLYVVLGVTVTTFFVFQWSVQHVSATTASLKDYLQLIVGVTINTIVLRETFTPFFFAGSALIIVGMGIVTGKRLTQRLLATVRGG